MLREHRLKKKKKRHQERPLNISRRPIPVYRFLYRRTPTFTARRPMLPLRIWRARFSKPLARPSNRFMPNIRLAFLKPPSRSR